MKFSEKFKKNKSEAVETETAQDFGKKKHKPDPKKLVGTISKKHIKNGTYSMAMAAIFIVIVVVINMIVGAIPSKYSQLDVSSSKLYTIGDETKKVLKALDKDVTIYQIAPSGSEDDTISNLLSRYKDESKHIKVEVKDPVVNPKFASEYTSDDLASNSLIVVCGDRNKVINYNDMYSTSVDYNTWQQTTTGFDGEGQITSAIQYVTMDANQLPVVYQITGHDEATIGSAFSDVISKSNMTLSSVELLNEESVPKDAAAIIINAPQKDFNKNDAQKVIDYLQKGGKAIIVGMHSETEMPNFASILDTYGVSLTTGPIADNDAQHYYNMGGPLYLLPNVNSSSYTGSLSGGYVYLPISLGINYPQNSTTDDTESTEESKTTYTSLLDTSDDAVAKNNPNSMQEVISQCVQAVREMTERNTTDNK